MTSFRIFWLKNPESGINGGHIMLRDLLTQIASTKKPSTTWYAPEHVDSENINLKIGHWRVFYQLFSKTDSNS
jgi:hypothetical protein